MEKLFLKIRRRETPFWNVLYTCGERMRRLNMPAFTLPFYRVLNGLRLTVILSLRRIATFIYYEPMFRSRCRRVGSRLNYVKTRQGFPYFHGNLHIFLGDNVTVHSRSAFSGASVFDEPCFRVGNNTYLGPGLSVGVAREISIGTACLIGSNVSITDNDGHPIDPAKRAKGKPVNSENVRPVRISDNVWIGEGVAVLKGVSIGEGAIVGARSVVMHDVPPFSIAVGNPAKTVKAVTLNYIAQELEPSSEVPQGFGKIKQA